MGKSVVVELDVHLLICCRNDEILNSKDVRREASMIGNTRATFLAGNDFEATKT